MGTNLRASQEPPAATLSGAEFWRAVQAGINVRISAAQMAAFAAASVASLVVNAQTGTSYTILTGDRSKLVTFSNTSAVAVTLPQAGTSFPSGWFFHAENRGSGIVTITPTTSTVDGNATLVLWPGQGAVIASDGTNYFTQRGIASPLRWFNVKDYGALGDGSTDDTTAIQAAITACNAAGGGVIFFPDGVYIVGGALQDTGGANAQLTLPARSRTTDTFATIEFRGVYQPAAVPRVTTLTESPLPTAGSTIKSTLNTGTGALLGTYNSGVFNYVRFVSSGMRYRMHADPTLSCLDLRWCSQIDIRDNAIDASAYKVRAMSVPTTTTSYAIRTPSIGNGAFTKLHNVIVVGHYNGIEVSEHAYIVDCQIHACAKALVFVAADHQSYVPRVLVQWCTNVLTFTGGNHCTKIDELDIEHGDASPWTIVYDVDDASNFGRGEVYWRVVLAETGDDTTFNVNGANRLKRERIGANFYNLTDGTTIAVPGSVGGNYRVTLAGNRTLSNPTNPWNGQILNFIVKQDATGSRTLAYGTKYKFPGGAPALSTATNAIDFISCQYNADDDALYCAISKAMS